MIAKISDRVWKFTGTDHVNVYFLDLEKKVIIDTGNRADRQEMQRLLGKVVDFEKVDIVIFTHLHYDHIGNFDLFVNAEFYASEEEIREFRKSASDAILNDEIAGRFNVELKPLPSHIVGLEVIKTPGHTKGSICLWYKQEKVLFTGDTLLGKKMFGRTDLPTSAPQKMNGSILKLVEYNHKVMARGHEY